MRSPRSVTIAPIGIPARSRKAAIDSWRASHRLLANDERQVTNRGVERTVVRDRLADADIDDDLLDLRNFQVVAIT